LIHFVTYCVDIGKHNAKDLIFALNNLLSSIDRNIKDYHIIVYSNFDIKEFCKNPKVEVRKYKRAEENKLYGVGGWLNLSNNKIYTCRSLKKETGIDYFWIDLDSIVTADLSYLNDYPNMFITINADTKKPNPIFHNNDKMMIGRGIYICGSLWKLDDRANHIVTLAYEDIHSKKLQPRFDLQDVFNYAFYFYHREMREGWNPDEININGYNCLHDVSYSLSWSTGHPKESCLSNLYYNDNNELMSKINNKKVHILGWVMQHYKRVNQEAIDKALGVNL